VDSQFESDGCSIVRRAVLADIEPIAQLCKEFADDSVSINMTISGI